ncbi:MAG: hypothetical protein IJI66_10405 [Erysipelotrichaceae bacterium]|nr:hypothetical protein [Erysipelotrichaceae bacterium]
MDINRILKESNLSGSNIVQFMDFRKFMKYMNSRKASWQDYKNSEIIAVEYQDLADSDFLNKYGNTNVQYAYRKRFDDRNGIVLLIKDDDKKIRKFKKEAMENLVISGFSFQLKERRTDYD